MIKNENKNNFHQNLSKIGTLYSMKLPLPITNTTIQIPMKN